MALSTAALSALKRLTQLTPEIKRSAALEQLYAKKFGSIPLNDPMSKDVPLFKDWLKTLPADFNPADELNKYAKGGLAQMKECSCRHAQ